MKVDNEKINPFKVIASFPCIKERVDQTNGSEIAGIEHLIGTYRWRLMTFSYSFGYTWLTFQAPFQAHQWSNVH